MKGNYWILLVFNTKSYIHIKKAEDMTKLENRKIIQMPHRKSILYHFHILDFEECDDTIDDYDC
jgi:hypothetical protein